MSGEGGGGCNGDGDGDDDVLVRSYLRGCDKESSPVRVATTPVGMQKGLIEVAAHRSTAVQATQNLVFSMLAGLRKSQVRIVAGWRRTGQTRHGNYPETERELGPLA